MSYSQLWRGDEFTATVGKSTLEMRSEGTLLINGRAFDFSAIGAVQINAAEPYLLNRKRPINHTWQKTDVCI